MQRETTIMRVVSAVTVALLGLSIVVLGARSAWSVQGSDTEGHPTVNGAGVFAAWNPAAGLGVFGERPRGWDFRINYPETSLTATAPQLRSGAAMVGVVEDAAHSTLQAAQHVNNAIWMFAVDANGLMRFKVLPSRRSLTTNAVQNVGSVTTDWHFVGPRDVTFEKDTPAAAVVGEGIGVARLVVVARASDRRLLVTTRIVDGTSVTTWNTPWQEVAPRAGSRFAATAAFGTRVAIAWTVGFPARVDFRLFTPATAQLGAAQTAAAAGASPVMVWDGTALNLFFIGPFLLANVWHTTATSATNPTFGTPLRIGGTVLNSQCSAMSFNRRLHIACARFESGRSRIWYSTSTRGGIVGPPLGPLPWEPPSHVGLDDHAEPAIGAVGDEIYVVGINRDAILQYSRRDPHVRPYEWAGGLAPVERWLESGTDLDPSQRVRGLGLSDTRILSFNRDLYLTAARSVGSPSDGVYLVNFARAALRGFLVRRLGIGLGWGEDGDAQLIRPGDDTIAMGIGHYFLEDMNGDRRADLVRAAIVTGGGELRIARSLPDSATLLPSTLILSQFAHPSDFVQVGDVNGDGRKDIVRFFKNDGAWAAHTLLNSQGGFGTQLTSRDRRRTVENVDTVLLGDVTRDGRADMVIVRSGFANGSSAVIVAPGRTNGGFGSPQEWATTAAIFPDHPMLMDVNGDRAMDLVLIGSASSGLVRAALSTTTSFASPTQWGPALSNLCASFLAADMDQDGRDDLLCFVRDKPGVPGEPRAAYVLFAENGRFSLPNTLISRFGGVNDLPLVGNFSPDTKGDYTHVAADNARLVFDLMTVRFTDGRVGWRSALAQFPVPSGAPWENYRFFTEKGIGATMFPDWLWGPTPCVRPGHRFFLIGAAGNGGPSFTHLSVRPGSAETHVLEELGHSAFANCFRENNDTLGLFDDIFTIPLSAGGFDANSFNDTCGAGPAPWVDCRDPEHFFLRFMLTYRTNGTVIRNTIEQESDPAKRARYQARYAWLRTHWFNGVEFYVDATDVEGRRDTVGLPCLRGQCPGVGGKLDGIQ